MPDFYFVPDFEARGLPKAAAERLAKAGKKIRGVWMVTEGDLLKEYAATPRKGKDGVESSPTESKSRMEGDGNPTGRSAKESVGLGRNPRRSRKAVQKPHLHAVVGGAENMDVSEIRK